MSFIFYGFILAIGKILQSVTWTVDEGQSSDAAERGLEAA
jgi:hypothetical protein